MQGLEVGFNPDEKNILEIRMISNGVPTILFTTRCIEENGTHQCDRRIVKMFERVVDRVKKGESELNDVLFREIEIQIQEMTAEYWSWSQEIRDVMEELEK
jgi:hypothetical protein